MKTSVFYVIFFLIGIHLTGGARAQEVIVEKTFEDATAKITLDCTTLTFDVEGTLSSGSISAYSVYKNALVNDDEAGNVSITPGTEVLLDADGFVFGSPVTRTDYPIDNINDTYTFIFGQRSFGHGYYDVSVQASCNSSAPPQAVALEFPARVNLRSRTIPIKIILEPTDILPEDVDISSIEFGDPDLPGTASPFIYRYQDNDLKVFIRTRDLMDNAAFDENSTEALLTGTTYDGVSFSGSGPIHIKAVKTKGPKNKEPKSEK